MFCVKHFEGPAAFDAVYKFAFCLLTVPNYKKSPFQTGKFIYLVKYSLIFIFFFLFFFFSFDVLGVFPFVISKLEIAKSVFEVAQCKY